VIKTAGVRNLQIAVTALKYSASVLRHFVLRTRCSSKTDVWTICRGGGAKINLNSHIQVRGAAIK
jgi:hypothetical protein